MPSSNHKRKERPAVKHPKLQPLTENCSITKLDSAKPTPASHNFFYITRQSSFYSLLKKVNRWLIHHQTTSNARSTFSSSRLAGSSASRQQQSGRTSRSMAQETGRDRVTLCAIGAAITKCCTLALALQDALLPVVTHLRITTGTVKLVDEVKPADQDLEESLRVRMNSKVQIELILGADPNPPKMPQPELTDVVMAADSIPTA